MPTTTSEAFDLKPGARGRKDRDGGEETIKIRPIKDAAADIMKLLRKQEAIHTEVSDAIKGLAERSGTNTRNLKRLFKASLKGNFADERRDVDQQSVLFEQVGEIQGGGDTEKE